MPSTGARGPAADISACQSARKIAPRLESKAEPLVVDTDASARVAAAGRGCGGDARAGSLPQSSDAVLEAPALVAGLDDVAVVGQTVEQRGRHFRIAEHARPFAEGKVGRHHHGRAFLELPRRMPERAHVPRIARGPSDHRRMAAGLQRPAPSHEPRRSHACRVRSPVPQGP